MNVYFDKEEAAFILDQPKGFVRRLVRDAMERAAYRDEVNAQVDEEPPDLPNDPLPEKDPTIWNQRDVFGPRLKR